MSLIHKFNKSPFAQTQKWYTLLAWTKTKPNQNQTYIFHDRDY